MIRRFPSLKNPTEVGYAFDTDNYDSRAFFSDKFRQYQNSRRRVLLPSGNPSSW